MQKHLGKGWMQQPGLKAAQSGQLPLWIPQDQAIIIPVVEVEAPSMERPI